LELVLPRIKPIRKFKLIHSFLLAVVIPTILASFYMFVFAADQYVSEFRFTISPTTFASPSTSSSSGSSAGQSPVVSGGNSAASAFVVLDYMVVDYLQSNQVVADLRKQIDLDGIYNKSSIDIVNRFWWGDGSIEKLARYWRNFGVYAWFD